jgi:hypothetical protein
MILDRQNHDETQPVPLIPDYHGFLAALTEEVVQLEAEKAELLSRLGRVRETLKAIRKFETAMRGMLGEGNEPSQDVPASKPFPRSRRMTKTVAEIARDFLAEVGKPVKIGEIRQHVSRIRGTETHDTVIYAAMKRYPDVFRSTMFGYWTLVDG